MTTKTTPTPHEEAVNKPRVSRTLLAAGLVFFVLFSASIAFAFYSFRFENKALPGVVIGGIPVSGMDEAQIKEALNARFISMIDQGLSVTHGNTAQRIELETSDDPEFNFTLISLDVDASAAAALSYGHRGPWYQRFWEGLRAPITQTVFSPSLNMNSPVLMETVRESFPNIENPGAPTDFVFDPTFTSATIQEGTRGTEIDTQAFFADLENDAADLLLGSIELHLINSPEPLSTEEAQTLIPDALALLKEAPFTLTYTTETKREYSWPIDITLLADIIVPESWDHGFLLGVEETKLAPLFTEIENTINVAPVDARFQIENGKVIEFVGSQEGVAFDSEDTISAIESAIRNSDTPKAVTIPISARTAQPDILTSEVNDLGITEVLGTGWSGWKGSPPNRIKNIRHATQKLDGLLIKPGEQISLISKLGPLTLADGYLPEMVIAGDEIKPEIAGGLCQIGTTVFRAAMNAGLQIDERRNHSLVVSYYNDPSNGNPGTDATLYEPVLDLKFTNTTAHHILLTAEFNESGEELLYTFWGTNSDDRKAYYTPPQVLSRSAPGPTQYNDTTTLPPGVTKCQNAYGGAKTTFDYIIEYPDGTRKVQNFTSQYRALPRICLVGVDPNAPPADPEVPEDETANPLDEPIPLTP